MGKGRNYEHDLAAELYNVTPREVWLSTIGFSGNSRIGSADIVVTLDPKLTVRGEPYQYQIEAKKRSGESGNRVTVASGGKTDETGFEEIERFVEGTPTWATPVLAIKFDRRELSVLNAAQLLRDVEHDRPVAQRPHEARFTEGGSLSMVKPTLDEWTSASAGRPDGVVLADELNIPYTDGD